MTGFLRPDAIALLLRWRDTIVGVVLLIPGLVWAMAGSGMMRPVGVVLALGGAALAVQGVRRARFPALGGGVGVVEVDERQITYFGPEGGGAVSIDMLVRVEVARRRGPGAPAGLTWILHSDGAAPLSIPGDAENAGLLFDALAPLPGVDYARAIAAGQGTQTGLVTIWQKPRTALH